MPVKGLGAAFGNRILNKFIRATGIKPITFSGSRKWPRADGGVEPVEKVQKVL